jgi:hypothetical protein
MTMQSKLNRTWLYLLLILVVGLASSAYAVPPRQLLRVMEPQTFTGGCCFSWNETVSIVEPAKIDPVVVTWSTDMKVGNGVYLAVGLSLNGGPCAALGPGSIREPFGVPDETDTRVFQFVVLPIDGLQKGPNTFTLCGGGRQGGETITIGPNTLEVRFAK